METTFTSWLTLAGLGAFHGLNPGMGWLFAVALGMQEGKRTAVWRALIPLRSGTCWRLQRPSESRWLPAPRCPPACCAGRWRSCWPALASGSCTVTLHPRWAAMRVGMGGLTLWSFLMASAHGAGLMVLPVFLSMTAVAGGPSCHARGASTQAACRCDGDAGAWSWVSGRDGAGRVVCGRSLRAGTPAEGLDQSGCDLGGGADSHRVPDSDRLRRLGR